jgi:hypothetical protein
VVREVGAGGNRVRWDEEGPDRRNVQGKEEVPGKWGSPGWDGRVIKGKTGVGKVKSDAGDQVSNDGNNHGKVAVRRLYQGDSKRRGVTIWAMAIS